MPNIGRKPKPRPGTRYGGGTRGGAGPPVSYGDADPALLHRVVCGVTNAGDAITFGRTSEGGAYYVGVLADGLLEKFYLDDRESLHDALLGIAEAGESLIQ